MKPETVNREAKALTDNPKIATRIEELHAAARERHEVTVDTLTCEIDEDRALAHKAKQAGAAVAATLGKAKLHGLLKDRHELTGPRGVPVKMEVTFVSPDGTRKVRPS